MKHPTLYDLSGNSIILPKAVKLIESARLFKQGLLVNESIGKSIFKCADLTNYIIYIDKKTGSIVDDYMLAQKQQDPSFSDRYVERVKIIYSWYALEEWLAEIMSKHYEPILKNKFGIWWGHTRFIKSLPEDPIIQKIAGELYDN